jgi:hypothetical protein
VRGGVRREGGDLLLDRGHLPADVLVEIEGMV